VTSGWRQLSVKTDECREDEKEELDVTDRDAEWRSMAPRDHRVIGSRRPLRHLLGPHTTATGSQLNTPADALPAPCRPRNNLIINSVSVWPTNRPPNGSRDLTDARRRLLLRAISVFHRITLFAMPSLLALMH